MNKLQSAHLGRLARKIFPPSSPPFSNTHADGEHVYCGFVHEQKRQIALNKPRKSFRFITTDLSIDLVYKLYKCQNWKDDFRFRIKYS